MRFSNGGDVGGAPGGGGVGAKRPSTAPSAQSAAARIQGRFRKFLADRAKRVARERLGPHAPLPDTDSDDDRELPTSPGRPKRAASGSSTGSNVDAKMVKCFLLVLAWFGLSTSLALFNKALFGQRKGGFPAPLLLTSVQFFMQWALASLALERVVPHLKPRRAIDWRTYVFSVAPVGVAMGLDIGLSNLALVYVTVSFYTLAKTCSILFLLAFAFYLGVERFSLRLTAAMLVLTLGELLTVHGETQFNAAGFALCILAAAASGTRWVLSQVVLHSGKTKRDKPKRRAGGVLDDADADADITPTHGLRRSHGMHSPPVMLRAMMPVMCAVVFFFSCFKERWWASLPGSPWLSDPFDLASDLLITLVGAFMALCMSMAEFELVKETSAVTVSVVGTAKDVVTVLTSVLVFRDAFGVENALGLVFVVGGIGAYNYHKIASAREKEETNAARVELAQFAANEGGGGGGGWGAFDGGRDTDVVADADATEASAGAALAAELGVGPPVVRNDAGKGRYVPAVTTRSERSAMPLLPRTGG
jgi:solute carrier family 35 protein C2